MGGLVISEALHQSPSAPWVPLVSDVVTLGSPFLGAPLERAARTALGLAGRSSVVAPIVRLGDHRSVGIRIWVTGSTRPRTHAASRRRRIPWGGDRRH